MTFQVPPGFEPVLHYGNNDEPTTAPNQAKLAGSNGEFSYYAWKAGGDPPALPIKASGKLWHRGWDIPTVWTIDANLCCWMNDAHGGCQESVDQKTLLSNAETEEDKAEILAASGMPTPEPAWMAQARAHGWRPPGE